MPETDTTKTYNPNLKDYFCMDCGRKNCKLWRIGACSCIELRCARCGWEYTKEVIPSLSSGELPVLDVKGMHRSKWEYTDKLGHLVPAVPTPDGEEWWGYTSVPEEGVRWWQSLPNGV
jgi:hypothetical protein